MNINVPDQDLFNVLDGRYVSQTAEYYTTGTELVSSLDVYKVTKSVIYEILIPSLDMNDIVMVTAQFESTNPLTYNVMLGRYLYLISDQTSFYINRPATCNTTPNMHHQNVNLARSIKIAQPLTNVKIQLVAYAAASKSTVGVIQTIEPGYGHLDCVIRK